LEKNKPFLQDSRNKAEFTNRTIKSPLLTFSKVTGLKFTHYPFILSFGNMITECAMKRSSNKHFIVLAFITICALLTLTTIGSFPSTPTSVFGQSNDDDDDIHHDDTSPINDDDKGDGNDHEGEKNKNNDHETNRFVILTFDGGYKGHFTAVKPILDKYGFKATFYVVCNYAQKATIDNTSDRMNWNEIMDLYEQGHDVGAKSKNVVGFDELSSIRSQYVVSESKKCLQDQGINATSFVYPFNRGSNIKHITSTISDHFELALTTKASTSAPLMFLDCRFEYVETVDNNNQDRDANPDDSDSSSNDSGCREYLGNGSLSIINRYSIKAWSHDAERKENSLDDTQMLETFIEVANSQDEFNSEGKTTAALPIIMWHKIEDTPDPYCTSRNLFDLEMKYLHDNGFTVLTMANLEFDKNTNTLRVIDNNKVNNIM
jgi:hypothetical protein